ncbi:MAG TPA: FkbM family methyltransferase [Ilumatobacteraceae bacterium]|nr:FkbM family methyltransferase [Ilumatobacteraceae bacterium]
MASKWGRRARQAGSLLKRKIHQATAPRSAVAGADDVDRLTRLLFPEGVAAESESAVRTMLQADAVSASTVRSVLGAIDRQRSPTPFSVRLSPNDVAYVSVGGIEVALDKADRSVSAPIIADGFWEPHVEHVLRQFLTPGSNFVDIGANVGWHTALASSLVGSDGLVYAIEPNPDNARLIAHTIERNKLTNVRLLPVALGESAGFAAFRSAIGSNGGFLDQGESKTIDPNVTIVPTVRFDDLDMPGVDVIKIDVEGAEPIALRGASATIARDHPVIIFEFSCEMTERVGGVAPRDHLKMFESLGYALSLIEKPTGTLVAVDDIDQLLAEWGSPTRIEDFVAVRRS